MTIPSQIEIQIIDHAGLPNPIDNVLFGLKIFINETYWHNYSPFKSNPNGRISLTKQEIIANTELKWETLSGDKLPTEFELYVWEGQQTDSLIKSVSQLLARYDDDNFLIEDLRRHGMPEENIPEAITITKNKAKHDKIFYELIKDAPNNSLNSETTKISGTWKNELPQYYEFIIECVKNGG